MSDKRHYQGIDFEVWDGPQTWFWFVIDPHRDGGAIGAASNETEAVRDACLSIDAMMFARCELMSTFDWEVSLAKLERYLMQCCDSAAR